VKEVDVLDFLGWLISENPEATVHDGVNSSIVMLNGVNIGGINEEGNPFVNIDNNQVRMHLEVFMAASDATQMTIH